MSAESSLDSCLKITGRFRNFDGLLMGPDLGAAKPAAPGVPKGPVRTPSRKLSRSAKGGTEG